MRAAQMVQNIADIEHVWFDGKTILNRATLDTVGEKRIHSTVSDQVSVISILILTLYSQVQIELPHPHFSLLFVLLDTISYHSKHFSVRIHFVNVGYRILCCN